MTRFFSGVKSRAEISNLLVDRKCGKLFVFLPTARNYFQWENLYAAMLLHFVFGGNAPAVQFRSRARKPVEPAPAQSETKPAANTRLKIGVALEGGGALGIAHLGVLKWFEEHHIPVDYVAGTSMGGLVGGLYATGKSADELKQMWTTQTGHSCWAETFPTRILHFAARKTPATFRIISKSA